jgi:hypothetical protein
MLLILLLLFLCVSVVHGQGCHPLCTYECSSPTCPAMCVPVCKPANCEVCFNVSGTITNCMSLVGTGVCELTCPANQCESSECPVCEIQCDEQRVCGSRRNPFSLNPNCLVMCQEASCSWQCTKPTNCPYPQCQLQCDPPACAFIPPSDAARAATPFLLLSLTFTLLYTQ